MKHEKTIKRDDGTRYEIHVSFWEDRMKPIYEVSLYKCEPGKRKFFNVHDSDNYTWRGLNMEQRKEFIDKAILEHITPEEIHAAKLELWEKLKPQTTRKVKVMEKKIETRIIKFRGKRVDNGEWVYGYYVVDPIGKHRIYLQPFEDATSNTYYFVIPETVGQFTGMNDINGKEIYEGDIVKGINSEKGKVYFSEGCFMWELDLKPLSNKDNDDDFDVNEWATIIGNIHDDHELLNPKNNPL